AGRLRTTRSVWSASDLSALSVWRGTASGSWSVRYPVVMLPKQVISEIALQITPDRVNVVRIVLCIVVFHQKGRALHAIVMAFLRLEAPRPGEIEAFCSALLDPLQILVRQFRSIAIDILLDYLPEQFGLRLVQFRCL